MKITKRSSAIILFVFMMILCFISCNTDIIITDEQNQAQSDSRHAQSVGTQNTDSGNDDIVNFEFTVEDCGIPSMTSEEKDPEYFNQYFEYEDSKYRPHYNMGVCRELSGKQTIVLFFLDDDESDWDADSVELYTDKHIRPALDFLLKESEKWNNCLSFEVKRYSTALSDNISLKYEGKINPDLFNGGSSKDVPDQIAEDLGYSCDMELLKALEEEYSNEKIVPLVFVNKSGRSYARHQLSGYDVNYLEHAVIFSSSTKTLQGSWKKTRIYTSTIAHEFLHLFGANDLYSPDNRLILAEKYCINDIMLLDHRNISKLVVDDSTAYQIGWHNKVSPIFKEKDWE